MEAKENIIGRGLREIEILSLYDLPYIINSLKDLYTVYASNVQEHWELSDKATKDNMIEKARVVMAITTTLTQLDRLIQHTKNQ